MLYNQNNTNNQSAKSRKALLLVFLFVSSLFVSLVPAVSASHITQYAVQRDPSYISIGDLDCDGDNDIAMINYAGLGIAWKAYPKVKKAADLSLNKTFKNILYIHILIITITII